MKVMPPINSTKTHFAHKVWSSTGVSFTGTCIKMMDESNALQFIPPRIFLIYKQCWTIASTVPVCIKTRMCPCYSCVPTDCFVKSVFFLKSSSRWSAVTYSLESALGPSNDNVQRRLQLCYMHGLLDGCHLLSMDFGSSVVWKKDLFFY